MSYAQYFDGIFEGKLPNASISDLTPPTFAGIATLTQNADGTLQASWSAATDTTLPVRYEIYLQAGTATGLFSTSNIQKLTNALTARISTLVDGVSPLVFGVTYYIGVRAVDAIGNREGNTASLNQTITFANFNTVAAAVWDQLKSAHTVPDSFGDYLDIKVSSRLAAAAYTAPDNASIAAIKVKTDNLPASPASEITSAAIKAKTDNLPVDPASNTQVNTRAPASTALDNTVWTNAKAAFIDAAISSRMATFTYTAPDNTGIAAIKAKTDNLPVDPASNTQVLTRAPASSALDNAVWTNAKAAFLDVAISTRATPSDIASAVAVLAAIINAVPGSVWEQLLSAHTTAGTFGANAQNPPLDPSQIADAVWDALLVDHVSSGSFGANAQNPPLNPDQIADAVWDALRVDHNGSGTFGESNQNSVGGGSVNLLIGEVSNAEVTGEFINEALEGTIEAQEIT
jgi:hypothetical protein